MLSEAGSGSAQRQSGEDQGPSSPAEEPECEQAYAALAPQSAERKF